MRLVHLSAVAVIAFTASPAAAAITIVNLAGVVTGGSDNGYVSAPSPFGLPPTASTGSSTGATSAAARGQRFFVALRIDESLGAVDLFSTGQSRYGGGAQSPLQAVFTMNGHSFAFGNLYGSVDKGYGPIDSFYASAVEQRLRPSMTGDFTNVTGDLSLTLNLVSQVFQSQAFSEPARWTRLSRAGSGPNSAFGSLALSLQDTAGTPLAYTQGPLRTANLTLRIDSFSIAGVGQTPPPPPPAPVPEPSTWTLLISGFGMAGAALRRRRWTAVRALQL